MSNGYTDLHALTGAYAVDALDDIERARFERHLDECPECVWEVRSLREAAALLPSDGDASLPAHLRGHVLSGISEVRPLPPFIPLQSARATARRFPRMAVATAAAFILAAGVGIGSWHPWASEPRSEVTAASRVIDAADAQQTSARMPGGGRATVVHSATLGRVVVMTQDVPQAPDDSVYELWLQNSDGVLHPAGTLSGGADTTVVLSHAVKDAKGVGITIEPAEGSDKPSSSPLALLPLHQA